MPEGQKSYSKTKPIQVKEFDPIKKWWNNRKESDVCWKVDMKTIIDRGYDLDIKNPHNVEEEIEFSSQELVSILSGSFKKSNQLLEQLQKQLRDEI